jgi:transcriptional regulatory protein RtcR
LIAGTNRDLQADVAQGRFRDDLLARINMWTFRLPALRDRREDIEPNLDFELEQFARTQGRKVTFNKEAREHFLRFATTSDAIWSGNFRDLNAAVTRMATLAAGGRITIEIADDEMNRLRSSWSLPTTDQSALDLGDVLDEATASSIDPFDRVQLAEVVRVCRENRTLSEAGRYLFAVSRSKKGTPNDADRLRKYLARFGLDWARIQAGG